MPDLVDSHVHLEMLDNAEEALAEARRSGVERILAVGCDLRSSRLAVGFAAGHEDVQAAVGIHPHDAAAADKASLAAIEELAKTEKVVAVGETGLDFYREHSPRRDQVKAFKQQIAIARRTGRALIVHSREAGEETLEILASEATGLTVVLHCFALTEHVRTCIEAGYYISFAGNVTYPKAESIRAAASEVPPELLLTETDSPYLAPVPFRGKTNSPALVGHPLHALADLRGTSPEGLAAQVLVNYQAAFDLT